MRSELFEMRSELFEMRSEYMTYVSCARSHERTESSRLGASGLFIDIP
jgi:hypothetical protein